MKAYSLTADYVDEGLIVFAATPGKAKSLKGFSPELCDVEWVNLICKRNKDADKFHKEGRAFLSFSTEEGQRAYRELGWTSSERWEYCISCDQGVWDLVPESFLDDNGKCEECQEGGE